MKKTIYKFVVSEDINLSFTIQVHRLLEQLGSIKAVIDYEHFHRVVKLSRFLIALQQDTIVGAACLIPIVTLTRECGIIEHVVVDKKMRQQGIGTAMILKLIEEARHLGLSRLDLTSRKSKDTAHVMYLKLGFKIRDTCNFRLEL